MEGLVNYSSEDEQDVQSHKFSAERGGGSQLKRSPPNYDAEAKRRRGGEARFASDSGTYASVSSEGRSGKEEEKFSSPSTAYSANKSSSQSNYNREGRGDARENKYSRDREARNSRDYRDNPSKDNRDYGNKSDYKNDRLNRSKEYCSRDHRRDDNFHDNRRARNQRASYGNSSSKYSASHQDYRKNNRYNNSRHNDSSTSRRYHGSRDDRSDYRSDRYESRKQRSPTSRSPSPSSSSNNKRYTDEHRTRHRGHESRSRSRSRSHSPVSQRRSQSPRIPPKSIDQARKAGTVSDLERNLNSSEYKTESESSRQSALGHMEAVITLPLSETAAKPPTVIAVAPISSSGKEPAVIQLPSYYNPSVINPNKYAEQVQKRKLIWGAKKTEDISAKWGHAQFSQDSDGKVASKFMRLMGIKSGATAAKGDTAEDDKQPATVTDVKSREKMFNSMEKQYEVARQVTHTMRGVGLGFSSQARQF